MPTDTAPRRNLIVGGFNAMPGRFPYGQVSLFPKHKRHQCGGSVVAPDMILTAGHCHDVFNTTEIGKHDKSKVNANNNHDANYDHAASEFRQVLDVVQKIRHPAFQADLFRYDVMLAKVAAPIQGVAPVQLNANPHIPEQPTLLTLIGWGTTDGSTESSSSSSSSSSSASSASSSNSQTTGRTFPTILQQAFVPYVPNDMCENSVYNGNQLYQDEIFDEMMCAGQAGVDACRGDSGSPLLLELANGSLDVQVGLVSWGRGCGKYPGVYTRLSVVFPWIRSQICWHSMDPPAYLNCQAFERPPPTAAPSTLPSVAPSALTVNGGSPLTTFGTDIFRDEPDAIAAGPEWIYDDQQEPASRATRRDASCWISTWGLLLALASYALVDH